MPILNENFALKTAEATNKEKIKMKKIQIIFAIMSMVIIASISAYAQNPGVGNLKVNETNSAPDLIIGKFVFVKTNDKALRVYIYNQGNKPAGANRLLLSVGKIDGISVNRTKVSTVPPLSNGNGVWLVVNAKSILPNDVAIKSTVFKLNVDSTQIVAESVESNNGEYYEPKSEPQIDAADSYTANLGKPDLRIRQIKFSPNNDKLMEVQVYNGGSADAPATEFLLAIGIINGVKVNRRDNFKMPALAKGKFVWVKINASSLLPNNVTLESTTFRLTVDVPDIVDEPNESNNNYYHNKP